jgi:hypothetical protein
MSDEKKPTDGEAKEMDEEQLEQVAGGAASPTESITFVFGKIESKWMPGVKVIGEDGIIKVIGEDGLAPARKK